jgi:hypothetical protein
MPAQFLISDHAMSLAKVIAGMFHLNPAEEKEAFCMICEACKAAFVKYEEKADRMHKRVNPGRD